MGIKNWKNPVINEIFKPSLIFQLLLTNPQEKATKNASSAKIQAKIKVSKICITAPKKGFFEILASYVTKLHKRGESFSKIKPKI